MSETRKPLRRRLRLWPIAVVALAVTVGDTKPLRGLRQRTPLSSRAAASKVGDTKPLRGLRQDPERDASQDGSPCRRHEASPWASVGDTKPLRLSEGFAGTAGRGCEAKTGRSETQSLSEGFAGRGTRRDVRPHDLVGDTKPLRGLRRGSPALAEWSLDGGRRHEASPRASPARESAISSTLLPSSETRSLSEGFAGRLKLCPLCVGDTKPLRGLRRLRAKETSISDVKCRRHEASPPLRGLRRVARGDHARGDRLERRRHEASPRASPDETVGARVSRRLRVGDTKPLRGLRQRRRERADELDALPSETQSLSEGFARATVWPTATVWIRACHFERMAILGPQARGSPAHVDVTGCQ
jgi:hypothetical protein